MTKYTSYRPAARGWSWSNLLRDLAATWRLLLDPKVPGMLKLMLPLLALLYWVWPLDLIPGLPLDDLALVLLAARLFVALAPQESVHRAFNGGAGPTASRAHAGRVYPEDDANVIDTTWRVVDD
ncbi:MAG TPA: hypothetical protein VNK95_00700 [Caldilineaceae bacterium]|nr:hypothetical protein [Caldilineaceae bacterium]